MDKLLPVLLMVYIYAAVFVVLITILEHYEIGWSPKREFLVHICGISTGTIAALLVI